MLWILSPDVVQIDFSKDAISCAALENILSAVFSGYHLLHIESADIKKLQKQSSNFSNRSKAVISKISGQIYQNIPDIKYRVVISKSCKAPIKKSSYEWEIPFDKFSDHAVANRTILLAEDLIDANLFYIAAKHYLIKNKLKGFEVSSKSMAGGGSRTKSVFEQVVSEEEAPCICVTDSDKYFPLDSMSDTAKDCNHIASKSMWPVTHVATDSRELENILPRKFICEVIDPHQLVDWKSAEKFSSVFPHLDIKEGTCLHWVLTLPTGSPCRIFWEKELQGFTGNLSLDQDCLANKVCELGCSEKCNCLISKGVGTKVAEKVRDYLLKHSHFKSSEQVDMILDKEWLSIGKEVFEWCCAVKPIRC